MSTPARNRNTKSMLLLGILITSAIGAYFSGWVADKIGLRKTLLSIIGGWTAIFPLLGIITNFSLFVALTIVMGFLFGSIWTVTRATMTALTPKDKLNFGFSFYTLAERVSTLIGPLAWGIISSLLISYGPLRYRIAIIFIALFISIGFYFTRKIKL